MVDCHTASSEEYGCIENKAALLGRRYFGLNLVPKNMDVRCAVCNSSYNGLGGLQMHEAAKGHNDPAERKASAMKSWEILHRKIPPIPYLPENSRALLVPTLPVANVVAPSYHQEQLLRMPRLKATPLHTRQSLKVRGGSNFLRDLWPK